MMGCDVGVGYTRKQNVSTIDTCHGQPGRAGTRQRERRSPECPVGSSAQPQPPGSEVGEGKGEARVDHRGDSGVFLGSV
jgi:hypothetical protein